MSDRVITDPHAEEDWSYYSDYYKSVHGFRPRFAYDSFMAASNDERREMLEQLRCDWQAMENEEREFTVDFIHGFRRNVASLRSLGKRYQTEFQGMVSYFLAWQVQYEVKHQFSYAYENLCYFCYESGISESAWRAHNSTEFEAVAAAWKKALEVISNRPNVKRTALNVLLERYDRKAGLVEHQAQVKAAIAAQPSALETALYEAMFNFDAAS